MPDPKDAGLRERWTREVRTRLAPLRLSPAREAEIVDELSQHLDDRWRELTSGGSPPDEATRLTLAEFREGNVLAAHMSALRQARQPPPLTPAAPAGHALTGMWQDLRYAVRMAVRRPGFAAGAS